MKFLTLCFINVLNANFSRNGITQLYATFTPNCEDTMEMLIRMSTLHLGRNLIVTQQTTKKRKPSYEISRDHRADFQHGCRIRAQGTAGAFIGLCPSPISSRRQNRAYMLVAVIRLMAKLPSHRRRITTN